MILLPLTKIDDNVFAGPMPKTKDWKLFQELGIKYVVNLMLEPHNENFVNEHDVRVLHVPVKNYTSPSMAQIEGILDFIEQHPNQKVLIHCWAGLGRTGTVIACYLIKHKGMTANEAIQHIRSLRPGSVETKDQEMTILTFSEKLANNLLPIDQSNLE
jgi:atypical dual specificity phosphatase